MFTAQCCEVISGITTCNRLDLLEQTLTSFFNLCKFPFAEYIMSDDSGDDFVYQQLVEIWGDKFKIIQKSFVFFIRKKGITRILIFSNKIGVISETASTYKWINV